MQKLSVILLPVACLLVIFLSFYLLSSPALRLHIQKADAANHPPRSAYPLRHQVTMSSAKKPTPTPTASPTPTPLPTSTPTPTKIPPTPTPTQAAALAPQPSSSDGVQSYIMQKINDYRRSVGLSSVAVDSNTCSFAKSRAQEITSNFNHDGFTNRINSHSLPYTSYHEVTENIAMTSDYQEVVTMWINSPGHAENMRQDTPYVCVEKSGNYYAYEGWRP